LPNPLHAKQEARLCSKLLQSPSSNSAHRRATRVKNLTYSNVYVTIQICHSEVVEYVRDDGSNPYRAWFDDLSAQAAAKVATARARLEMGNTSAVKWLGVIGEYRIDWGPGLRIYLAKDGEDLVILLGGGTKRRQQVDIQRARILWTEYKARKSALRPKRR
jgi:putative addiction module killer protein